MFNDLPRSTVETALANNQAETLARSLFTYDALDRLIREIHFEAEQATTYHQVDYVWDLVGNLYEKTVTNNGDIERSSFTYNERDELIDEVFSLNGAIQWTGDFDYDPQGNLTRSQRGDTTIDYEYDIRNRLAVATNTTARVTTTAEYEYCQGADKSDPFRADNFDPPNCRPAIWAICAMSMSSVCRPV